MAYCPLCKISGANMFRCNKCGATWCNHCLKEGKAFLKRGLLGMAISTGDDIPPCNSAERYYKYTTHFLYSRKSRNDYFCSLWL